MTTMEEATGLIKRYLERDKSKDPDGLDEFFAPDFTNHSSDGTVKGLDKFKNFVAEVILFSDIQIKNDDVLTIHYGTAEKKSKVTKILTEIDSVNLEVCSKKPKILDSESVGEIKLTPLEPISIEKYSDFPELGRFVIQGKKGTVAAGIVLSVNN